MIRAVDHVQVHCGDFEGYLLAFSDDHFHLQHDSTFRLILPDWHFTLRARVLAGPWQQKSRL